ncbi:thioredoxin-related transmembrane protein 1 [Motacilla alba alba]|uniref:thioredoxin-related transmembrane protein 1 n=1 Tax=Motacilla alba alba TaxID=1094192 RepID=UPI0018D50B05|nr:thioredoxin-related transmembrane protein 1 [Motacilla alba alba]
MAAPGRARAALRAPLCALLCLALAAAALGKPSPVKVLSDGMWRELLQDEWMVEFYAPWCPACQNLQPEWEKFAEWGEDLGVNVAKVDVTEQPGLSGRFVITALPTIYHCKDGEFRRYQGARTKAAFINFINDKEWKSIEPVSSWFGPSSLLMSSMSALFKLSMWIRHGHGYLTENLGIPVWGSYAVFGLATLFLGMVLGLMMVFLADCICPSKRHRPPQLQPQPRKQGPESAHLLKNRYEEQEAEEGDISDDEAEGKDWSKRDSSPSGVRRRIVPSAAPLEKS